MKRDVAIIPFDENQELVIAADNSGSIGMLEKDNVKISYDMVSYYNFRVAYMECVAAGAEPIAITLHNFSGHEAWNDLIQGIERGIDELKLTNMEITGSTETNFRLQQSAVGLTVIGKRKKQHASILYSMLENDMLHLAIIGVPLVGNEVIDSSEKIAPLNLFQLLSRQPEVYSILPVGSKGILHELHLLFAGKNNDFSTNLDMNKTSGPATCFIIAYHPNYESQLVKLAGTHYHEVSIIVNE